MKTERSARRDERPGDTIPEQAHVYVPPRPLASLSDHRTMDVKAIRLAAEVDPRQALTELRLEAPPRRRPAKDWVAPVAFAVLAIGFIALWWATPGPLPLGNTTDPGSAPLAPPSQPLVAPNAAPAAARPLSGEPSLPARDVAEDAPAAPVAPAPLALPDRAERTAVPPNATATPGAPTAAVRTSAEPPGSPRRPKGGRNPWLE